MAHFGTQNSWGNGTEIEVLNNTFSSSTCALWHQSESGLQGCKPQNKTMMSLINAMPSLTPRHVDKIIWSTLKNTIQASRERPSCGKSYKDMMTWLSMKKGLDVSKLLHPLAKLLPFMNIIQSHNSKCHTKCTYIQGPSMQSQILCSQSSGSCLRVKIWNMGPN